MTVLQPDLPLAGAGAVRLRWPLAATLALIPAGFVMIGLVIRYFGYAASVGDESIAGFPMGMCRWDCGWYIYIAEHGYHHFPTPGMNAAGNWAFFPLMPVFVGLVHMVLAMVPTMTLATGISILMAYVTSIIAWPLLGRDLKAYTIFSAYLLAGPWSIYFTTFMTEAAFILITTAALVALERRSYLSAGIAAGLLSATRIVGVFMSIAMAAQLLGDHIAARKPLRSFIPEILRRPDILLGLLLAPMGAFVYMAFLRLYVGDGLAFLHVQRAWARAYGNPLMFVWDALTDFPKTGWIPTFPQQLAAAVITGFVLTAILFVRRKWAAGTFSLISITVPLFAGMASTLRFTAAMAPLPILGSRLLARNWLITGIVVLGFFVADYYVARAWIDGALSLV